MCYVIPFTLPCCRRIYVSVTKMKDCPADWPKTKCPKELCFQIGLQPDDRDEGTCWRCKAAEACIPPDHREKWRPGIDTAGVERFIVSPEERRSQMEEDGFCWFCGHVSGCVSCEPMKDEAKEGVLFGKYRQVVAKEKKPLNKRLNKRLKFGHTGARSRLTDSGSKGKTGPVSMFGSEAAAGEQSTPLDLLRQRQYSSPSGNLLQISGPRFRDTLSRPAQEYAGYGDQSHIFDPSPNVMCQMASSKPEPDNLGLIDPRLSGGFQPNSSEPSRVHPLCGDQSCVLDASLLQAHTASSSGRQRDQPYGQPRAVDLIPFSGTEASPLNHQQWPPYASHQNRSQQMGQFDRDFDPDHAIADMRSSNMQGDYDATNILRQSDLPHYEYPDPTLAL